MYYLIFIGYVLCLVCLLQAFFTIANMFFPKPVFEKWGRKFFGWQKSLMNTMYKSILTHMFKQMKM